MLRVCKAPILCRGTVFERVLAVCCLGGDRNFDELLTSRRVARKEQLARSHV
jgi:hypothetical protein